MNPGTSSRTPLMSRTAPVAAGMALMAANGSAMPSCPITQSEHTCSQNRPGLPMPGCASGTSSSAGMCGTVARLVGAVVRARRDGHHLVEAAADHAQVVLDDRCRRDGRTSSGTACRTPSNTFASVEPFARDQRRRAEERAEEGRALHPVAHLDVGRLLPRDRERVEHVELDVPLADRRARAGRQRAPERVRREVALDHEHAAVGEPVERIAVAEHVRVGREHDVDVLQLAVQQDRVVREHRVERRRLPLLLGAVLRVRLDLEPEQLERRHREVLAHRDRAPAAHRMDAHRGRSLRQQVRDRQRRAATAPSRADSCRRASPARSGASGCACLRGRTRRRGRTAGGPRRPAACSRPRPRCRRAAGRGCRVRSSPSRSRAPASARSAGRPACAAGWRAAAVLDRLRHRRADLAQHRRVDRQRLVGALQHHDALLSGEQLRERSDGNGRNIVRFSTPTFSPRASRRWSATAIGVRHHRALADDHPLRVLEPMAADTRVAASGERRVLVERARRSSAAM